MPIFKRKPTPASALPTRSPSSAPDAYLKLSVSTTDWTDVSNIKNEWTSQVEGKDEGLLGWRNGMRLYEQGPVAGQRMNVAEYMTRGLAYDLLGEPLFSAGETVETVRRVLQMIESMPRAASGAMDLAFYVKHVVDFAPRISRLALAVTRNHAWQPVDLGGDGQVSTEILEADRRWVVWNCVRCPGIADDQVMSHFFGK